MLVKGDRSLVALLLPDSCIKSGLQIIAQGHRCLLAYPENTYIADPAMTRYEFAPGLDACLEQIQQQLAILNTGVFAGDLETLRRLQEQYTFTL